MEKFRLFLLNALNSVYFYTNIWIKAWD